MTPVETLKAHLAWLNAQTPTTDSARACRNQTVWEVERTIREIAQQEAR